MKQRSSITNNYIINRLCHQLIENHGNFSNTVLIGLQPRGVNLCNRIVSSLKIINSSYRVTTGSLDITFFRDDFRRRKDPLIASSTNIDISLEGKNVIIVDDVTTGRSVRASLDAILDYSRPLSVELLVLIDELSRHVPIQPDYRSSNRCRGMKLKVEWAQMNV